MNAQTSRAKPRMLKLDLSAWQCEAVRVYLLKTLARDGLEQTMAWLQRGELRFALKPAAAAETARHLARGQIDFASMEGWAANHLLSRVWHELLTRQSARLWEDLRQRLALAGIVLPALGHLIETHWDGVREKTYRQHLGVNLSLLTEGVARQSILRPFMGSVYSNGRPTVSIQMQGPLLSFDGDSKHLRVRDFSAALAAECAEILPHTSLRFALLGLGVSDDAITALLRAANDARQALCDSGRPSLARQLSDELRQLQTSRSTRDHTLAAAATLSRYGHLVAQAENGAMAL